MTKKALLSGMKRLWAFDKIYIEHERVGKVSTRVQMLMDETQYTVASNASVAAGTSNGVDTFSELWVLPLIGPSGSTKSKTIRHVTRELTRNKEPADIPILHVTLASTVRSTRGLQAAILAAYQDPTTQQVLKGQDYIEMLVNDHLIAIARERNTYIVILDEAHNVLAKNGPATAQAMAKAMKSLVNAGVFSLVIAGTDEVRALFSDTELASRSKEEIDFSSAAIDDPKGCAELFLFANILDQRMVEAGVVDRPIGLINSTHDCAMLFDITAGVVGQTSRIVRRALETAVADGKDSIDWEMLGNAYAGWRRLNSIKGRNCFTDGPSKDAFAAVEGASRA